MKIIRYEGKLIDSYIVEYRVRTRTLMSFNVNIIEDEDGNLTYNVDIPELSPEEVKVMEMLRDKVLDSISEKEMPTNEEDALEFLFRETIDIARRYLKWLRRFSETTIAKVIQWVLMEMRYGILTPFLADKKNVEDIHIPGVGRPIHVTHTAYGTTMKTNIVVDVDDDIDALVQRLVHMAGRHVSVATPIVDAQLPDGSRVVVTYKREVSPEGSSLTIRLFKEEPITIAKIIESKTTSPLLAAYFWFLLEHHKNMMIIGVTGSGKTTLLNALITFIPSNYKIVTVEEVREIRLPEDIYTNYEPLVVRPAYGSEKKGEVTLYDLVKATLRMRPDYLIVGEARGEEAYVLFQAAATGHGTLSTMHAETFEEAVQRLINPPMNVPYTFIPSMHLFLHISREKIFDYEKGIYKFIRRVREVGESILDPRSESKIRFNIVCRWDPKDDTHILDYRRSIQLLKISEAKGINMTDIINELETRAKFLLWLSKQKLSYRDVSRLILQFSNQKKRKELLAKLRPEIETMVKNEYHMVTI